MGSDHSLPDFVTIPKVIFPVVPLSTQRVQSTMLTLGLCLALATLGACKRRPLAEDAPPEIPSHLMAEFPVNHPDAAVQLTHGFYPLEGNSWRWAASSFGVVLAAPEAAETTGATLELAGSIPEVIVEALGPITITATVNGTVLEPETFAEPGDLLYSRPLDPALFSGEPITIEFTTDKALEPQGAELRELALVITRVALLTGQ